MLQETAKKYQKWLLFFYSVPSKPVNNRIKIWRRLAKAGAIQLKGAVYILPYSDEHYEFFHWLISEVTSLNGDGTLIMAKRIETMRTAEVIDLFNQQREMDYLDIDKALEEFERKIKCIKKGTGVQSIKKLSEQFNKHLKEFENIRKIDFFSSKAGNDLKKKIKKIEVEINGISGSAAKKQKIVVILMRIEDYQGKIWSTRKKPFVDRMASAWLIKKFIDNKAVFEFADKEKIKGTRGKRILFDIPGGIFTHISDKCTFEVLKEAFKLKSRALNEIAKIVHQLDIKDDKYNIPAAEGIEALLFGIRKTEADDNCALEKGMALFEMLYASKI
ncbi:MAG: chromate resistance protein [Thermodesulfovibrionia bacterium]|nr:MAG: chromate resistance protein [Thermodesulfovibrionia bacterium]